MAKNKSSKAKVTVRDLIDYITSRQESIPDVFLSSEKEVKRNIIYLFEALWRRPKIVQFLSKYNLLFNQEIEKNPLLFLNYLKMIIIENDIKKYDIRSDFFNFYQELNKIKELEEVAKKEQEQFIDIRTRELVANRVGQEIKKFKASKIDKKEQKNLNEKINKIIQDDLNKKINSLAKGSKKDTNKINPFLTELNEEIINELELTIIDSFIDEKKNQMVHLFIDKNSVKRYYVQDFKFDFFISKEFSIIQNDYLEDYDENKFIKYTVLNFWDYQRLRSEINKNFKRLINQ